MPPQIPKIHTLRLFKRAAVYLLLLLVGTPLGHCLRLPIERGLVAQAGEGGAYDLTPDGRDFLHPEREFLHPERDFLHGERDFLHRKRDFLHPKRDFLYRDREKIALAGDIIINTTATTATVNNPDSVAEAVIIRATDAKFSPSEASEAIWQALHEAGITPNRRTLRLASLPHISPDYVTAHYLQLKREAKAHQTGLLITILESGVPAPPLNANRHLKDCDCAACRLLVSPALAQPLRGCQARGEAIHKEWQASGLDPKDPESGCLLYLNIGRESIWKPPHPAPPPCIV